MPTVVNVTGRIVDATGAGVQNAVIRLGPSPRTGGSPEALKGLGVVLDPVEVLTGSDGKFVVPALVGFSYKLDIPAIGLSETFIAPKRSDIAFHLLGLVPQIQSAKDYVDADGNDHVIAQAITPRVATVTERFDVLVIQSAAAPLGPWNDVGELTLTSDTDSYQLDDSRHVLPCVLPQHGNERRIVSV